MGLINLADHQRKAVNHMKNGCILCGGVGTGKSRTALAYYYIRNGGDINSDNYIPMKNPKDLYIITTARKRDDCEWEGELTNFVITKHEDTSMYSNKVVIDSWNNIKKYANIKNAFFIFDEQRVVGKGVWAKTFIKIAKNNEWILLSATPGDTWQDYIPVFIANGFYKNRTEFIREHIIYKPYAKFPQVDRYVNIGRLIRLRRNILVMMKFERNTVAHHEDVYTSYNVSTYRDIMKTRWNPETNMPYASAAELCFGLRKIVNSDESRIVALLEIFEKHPKVIIFYNYDYELELLKDIEYGDDVEIAEWNGHKHQPVPNSKKWVYLVQYNAGSEGWNCIKTDTIIFYSQNYSYKMMVQASGRIDRMNTTFTDLYYYHLKSKAPIDIGISRALKSKKKFNETAFIEKHSF